ncbi:PIN domain protein [Treponema primitia ZAS-2]|uniref:PIN domain protein n=1 Tax=Treponema primitia (strain ATCC BAA-887 / DSM 12427 / ZAS-2) TaxID=545694 RepID=F5YQJ8_TREPZ|nr:PIN domain-containing protein [Treponema primitia]AEF84976.1 PIN domain protein [Treponema primitia ZAS-2]
MIYVFDNNTLAGIFRHYFRASFPTFWERFDTMVSDGTICSVREVNNELKRMARGDELEAWAKTHTNFFCLPTSDELRFITQIYSVPHFLQNLGAKKLFNGGAFADPFLIAKAYISGGTVVTQEKLKPHGAKIPNICKHFSIPYTDLQGFLQAQNWVFK